VTREFSAAVNRYYITINGDTQKYDAVGKDIPEPVKVFLTTYPIQIDKTTFYLPIAEQLRNPLFFFDDNIPGSVKSKLLTYLTGNDVLDSMAQQLNKDIFNVNRDIIKLEADVASTDAQLAQANQLYDQLAGPIEVGAAALKEVNQLITSHDKLQALSVSYDQVVRAGDAIRETIDTLPQGELAASDFSDLANAISVLTQAITLAGKLDTAEKSLAIISTQLVSLNPIEIPAELDTQIKSFQKLGDLSLAISKLEAQLPIIKARFDEVGQSIFETEDSISRVLSQITECPLYKKPCPLAQPEEESI